MVFSHDLEDDDSAVQGRSVQVGRSQPSFLMPLITFDDGDDDDYTDFSGMRFLPGYLARYVELSNRTS